MGLMTNAMLVWQQWTSYDILVSSIILYTFYEGHALFSFGVMQMELITTVSPYCILKLYT